jgi:RNA polymerase sigma-70 factor (ECF subfamily)
MRDQDDLFHVQRILAGNTAAYTILVEKHSEMAFSIAHKIVRSREDAEEIAQDAFVKAFQSLRSFKGDSKFSTWLYRIVYNASVSHLRKRKQDFTELDERVIGETTEDEIIENLDSLDSEKQAALVTQAINLLPPDESAIVTMFYLKENTIEDISQITGLSISNVKVKLFRIRKKLYEQLQINMKIETMV